jgi:hypothetical protein
MRRSVLMRLRLLRASLRATVATQPARCSKCWPRLARSHARAKASWTASSASGTESVTSETTPTRCRYSVAMQRSISFVTATNGRTHKGPGWLACRQEKVRVRPARCRLAGALCRARGAFRSPSGHSVTQVRGLVGDAGIAARMRLLGGVQSERESRWFDLPTVFQTVQVLTDPSDARVFPTRRCVLEARIDQGMETLLELDADRVVQAP